MATTSHIATPARVEVSALNEYIKEKCEPIKRQSAFVAELRAHGRETYNHDGQQMEWRPRFRRRRIRTGAGSPASISFPQTVTKRIAKLPWRSWDLGESVTKFERLATQGKSGWFKILADTLAEVADDFITHFAEKFYLDGNATATNRDLHGLESIFATTGTVTNSPVGNPSDSYAGHSTALGVTGTWTPETGGGWPTGTGYAEYCWWSPIVVDYNSTLFNGTIANWWYQWQEALAYALTYGLILQSAKYDICIMSANLLRQAKNSLQASQRFETMRDSTLAKLGFKTLSYEGLEIATEYGVPEAVAYLLQWDKIELCSMQSQLIETVQDYDIATSEQLIALDAYGNLKIESPAFLAKLAAISAAGTGT